MIRTYSILALLFLSFSGVCGEFTIESGQSATLLSVADDGDMSLPFGTIIEYSRNYDLVPLAGASEFIMYNASNGHVPARFDKQSGRLYLEGEIALSQKDNYTRYISPPNTFIRKFEVINEPAISEMIFAKSLIPVAKIDEYGKLFTLGSFVLGGAGFDVQFSESPQNVFGYYSRGNATKFFHWKSVEVGESDEFVSTSQVPYTLQVRDSSVVSLTSSTELQAGSSPGKTCVHAIGSNGQVIGGLNVVVYPRTDINLEIFLVKYTNGSDPAFNFTESEVAAHLNSIFGSAGVNFNVSIRSGVFSVNFDINSDGSLLNTIYGDLRQPNGFPLTEPQLVVNNIEPFRSTTTHFVVCVVDAITSSVGFAGYNGMYAFISDNAILPLNTMAHEIGHGIGLLPHVDDTAISSDATSSNLMWPTEIVGEQRLVYEQWERVIENASTYTN